MIARILICLALCLLPVVSGAQQASLTESTIQVADSAQIDANIATRLRDILQELGTYPDITVAVSDGVVTLRGTTTSQSEALALTDLAQRLEGVISVRNEVTETTDIVERLNPAMERLQDRWEQFLISLPLFLIAALVFGAVAWIGMWIARRKRLWNRIAPNAFIADLYRYVVRIVFLLLGLVAALDILNATALLSTVMGAAGIIGLALSFAVRDTVENFIASVLLSIRQPFGPNDVVEINGDEGKVIRLTSRATILLSFDGNHIRIPNSTVFKSKIVNFSRNPERRFKFTIAVEAETDLSHARQIATDTVQALPFILPQPAASAWLGDITDCGVEIIVTGWINQHDTSIVLARGEALKLVKHALETAGIAIPDTTYRIRMETLDPPASPKPAAAPAPLIEAVTAADDTELDKMIADERAEIQSEDLLDRDAQME